MPSPPRFASPMLWTASLLSPLHSLFATSNDSGEGNHSDPPSPRPRPGDEPHDQRRAQEVNAALSEAQETKETLGKVMDRLERLRESYRQAGDAYKRGKKPSGP